MQVDPHAAATVYVATPRGGELTLDPGREVVARVVGAAGDGTAKINLAGQTLDVTTDAPLRVGDEVRLSVTRADQAGVRLAIVTPEAASNVRGLPGPGASLVQELARAGVPVTPQLASAVNQVAEQLGGGTAAQRAVAALAGRDLVLSPSAAGRVAAALELAGSIGPALASLASRSEAVALALPAGAPTAAALRSLLAPGLSNAELAIARIVQSTLASAPGGPITLPTPASSSASVIQNYVSSQVAVTGRLDQLAAQNTSLGTAALLQARGQAATVPTAATAGLGPAALQAAIRGQAAAALPAGESSTAARLAGAVAPAPAATSALAAQQAPLPAAQAAATQAATSARANAHAAAATGAANAIATPTSAPLAGAVADLATLAARFAPALAPGAGSIGATSATAARGINAAEVAQQAPGAIAGGSATIAGRGASGDPLPLVTSLRAYLASPGAESDAARLLRSIGSSTPNTLAAAIRTLPEGQSLQLAGRLLDLMPGSAGLTGPQLHDLRMGVHAALDRLGSALAGPGGNEFATLRSVLEQVAANDPRANVAGDAARLLASIDGQQVLSRSAAGADPGYVYFQVPLPDGRGAEVLVRRDPGRRTISFDEFRIAFLLDTQQLGTLMIELDAHPASIRADVRTDIPELEPYLRARTDALVEPLTREARRQVTVTTGVFETEPPASLLDPDPRLPEPGVNEFYA